MRKAGDIITDLFRERFGPEFMETARANAGLFSSWAKIAAEVWPCPDKSAADDMPAAAVHSRIRELERGVLLVEADHPGWIQILQTKQAELLSAVQRRYPDLGIRGIAFRLSREPFSSSEISGETSAETPVDVSEIPAKDEDRSYEYRNQAAHGPVQRDEEFYTALKGLENSIKKRNRL